MSTDRDGMAMRLLQHELSQLVGRVKDLFPPGALVTLVVRNPTVERQPGSADVVIGDDDLDAVAVAVGRAIGGGMQCYPGAGPATEARRPA